MVVLVTNVVLTLLAMTAPYTVQGISIHEVGGVFCEANSARGAKLKCEPQKCEWKKWYAKHYEQPEDKPIERVVLR